MDERWENDRSSRKQGTDRNEKGILLWGRMRAMKVKKYKLILSLYILGMCSFLFLRCHEITSQQIAALMTGLILIQPSKVFHSSGNFKKIVFLMLLYIVIEAGVSLARYGQGVSTVGYYCFSFISLILYFYFTGIKNIKKDLFIDVLNSSRMLLGCMYVVTILAYLGVFVLDSYAYRLRNGLFRINAGDYLIVIGLLLTFGNIIRALNDGKKIFQRDKFWLALGIVYLIFISQTRMQLLACFTAFIVTYLLTRREKSKKVVYIAIGLLATMLAIQLPFVQNMINVNFGGLIDGTDSSMIPRIAAIEHYIEYGNSRQWMGWGYASVTAPSNGKYNLFEIYRGPWGTYYTDDVGNFAFYMMYGKIGVILLIILFARMFLHAYKDRYKEPHRMAVVFFVIITSFSLSLFDVERQSYLLLVLLCLESECSNSMSVTLDSEVE